MRSLPIVVGLAPATLLLCAVALAGCARESSGTANAPAVAAMPPAAPPPATAPPAAEPPADPIEAPRARLKPEEPPRPPERFILPPLVGKTGAAVRAALGEPAVVTSNGPGKVWRYGQGDCALRVFLYPDVASNSLQVLSTEIAEATEAGTACEWRTTDDLE
ncbi:hypothetical protein KAJ83_16240 [Marivibrio halodurans]|uniref:Secreted protein n=1 Tax=Marivibrio halodurans TaxID=2039722 RepID=A0A8J7V286_9PROT|nr:hypothetical protein [Marivibrio halodurans]MBP5858571.1 hypothetical protein [Marivibrio halodurans]